MKPVHPNREYRSQPFEREQLDDDPIVLFERWLGEAEEEQVVLPNAMTVATLEPCGHPTVRNVLLKGIHNGSLFFYTDYESTKAMAIDADPRVALNFYWAPMDRQISIMGHARRTNRQQSEAYFRTRPRESQLSAYISRQTEVVANRELLEARYQHAKAEFLNKPVPCKETWGGFEVIPSEYIFWQGRVHRLHDRFRYRRLNCGAWAIDRLSP